MVRVGVSLSISEDNWLGLGIKMQIKVRGYGHNAGAQPASCCQSDIDMPYSQLR